MIVDFTKWGLVVDGNVHCFVVCVLFGEKVAKKKKQDKDEYSGMLDFTFLCCAYSKRMYGSHHSSTLISSHNQQRKIR